MKSQFSNTNVNKKYAYWRIRVMYSMYIGYAGYYFTRKGFVFMLPAIMHTLHFDKIEVGLLGTIFYITYGCSKFINGLWADRVNPRYVMAFGLIATGIINVFLGTLSALGFFCFFWFLNGFFQGWGWPPCAKLLTHWYSQRERGIWWGVWNTSHTFGSTLIPISTGILVTYIGWRYSLHIFGVLSIVLGIWLLNRLCDTPEKMGLPPVEVYRNDYPNNHKAHLSETFSTKEIFLTYVLKNKYIWALSASYMLIYFIRAAVTDWGAVYLTQKGFSLLSSDTCLAFVEMGGFIGSLMAGWLSDQLFQGRRIPIHIIFCIGIVCSILIFSWFHLSWWGYAVFAFLIGVFIFGPQMLLGMAAAELSHRELAGASTGFLALFAYFGAALSGLPVGYIAQMYGWGSLLAAIIICAIIAGTMLIPLWTIKTTWE